MRVLFQNLDLKAKVSFLDPPGLYWACNVVEGKRGMMKGFERLKECLRVILSKNPESLACTFIHFNLLGWALPYSLYTLIFYCTFVPFL